MTFLVWKIKCWGPLRTVHLRVIIIHNCPEPLSSEICTLISRGSIYYNFLFTTMHFLPLKLVEYAAMSTGMVSCLHKLSCVMSTHSILLSWGLALLNLWLGLDIRHWYALPDGTILFKPIRWPCLPRHHHWQVANAISITERLAPSRPVSLHWGRRCHAS